MSKLTYGPTKTTFIIKKLVASECLDYIKNHCKTSPFCSGTDSSNNSGILKLNLVSLCLFDVNASKRWTHVFDMSLTGKEGGNTYKVFESIASKFSKNYIPKSN